MLTKAGIVALAVLLGFTGSGQKTEVQKMLFLK